MKKIFMFFIIIIMIILSIAYMYVNHQIAVSEKKQQNAKYEEYYNQEIYGADLASLINKVIDNNIQNNVEKGLDGLYVDNKKDSIRIDIKFTDDDTVHSMEEIYNGGTSTFIQLYNQIKFKCIEINHHTGTQNVSYMYFEQIST